MFTRLAKKKCVEKRQTGKRSAADKEVTGCDSQVKDISLLPREKTKTKKKKKRAKVMEETEKQM